MNRTLLKKMTWNAKMWCSQLFCIFPDRPDPPQDLELSDLLARSVRLTWIPGNENNSPVTRTILSLLLTRTYWTSSCEYSGITYMNNILWIYRLASSCRKWDVPSLQNSLFSMKRIGGGQANGKICPVTQVIRTLWTWIFLHSWTTSSEWLPSTVWVRADQAGHRTATRLAAHVSNWGRRGNWLLFGLSDTVHLSDWPSHI